MTYQVDEIQLSDLVNTLAGTHTFTTNMLELHGDVLRKHVLGNVLELTGDSLYEGFLLGEVDSIFVTRQMYNAVKNHVIKTWPEYKAAGVNADQVLKVSTTALKVLKFEGKELEFLTIFNVVCHSIQTGLVD